MKKLLALLLLVLFLSSNLFADSEAPDIRISDNDSDVLNINSDGTIPIDPTSPLTIDTLTVSTALNLSCGLLQVLYTTGLNSTVTCDSTFKHNPTGGSLGAGLLMDNEIAAISGLTVGGTVAATAPFAVDANGGVVSRKTTDLGWATVDGTDNTACNTICTSACVVGFQNATGVSVTGVVGCTDATADVCLCAGAS